ncbi:MAG: hypothetical protein EPO40_03025 [Myxococcaceae bacterium]|nr:MAG: hypothetical protein EPO40_03025 [Myxococcaceae bacterium]
MTVDLAKHNPDDASDDETGAELQLRPPGDVELYDALTAREQLARVVIMGWARVVDGNTVTRARAVAKQSPWAIGRLVKWAPNGARRAVTLTREWVTDAETLRLLAKHEAAGEGESYARVNDARLKKNLTGRAWLVGVAGALVAVALLAWWAPSMFAGFLGLAVIAAVGAFARPVCREPKELAVSTVVALGLGWVAWHFGPDLAALVPRPPVWAWWAAAGVAVVVFGVLGRREDQHLVEMPIGTSPSEPGKPSAEMIVTALCRSSIVGMPVAKTDQAREEISIIAPGVATHPHGYVVELELPGGVTVDAVVDRRENLAAALRRNLSTVWPSGNPDRHPGYLRLFLGHKPLNTVRQPPWPVAEGRPISIFDPIPFFTDEENRWVDISLDDTHVAMGGASGSGKSVGLRALGVAVAFDLQTRIIVLDGKLSGDLSCIRKLCHAYFEGAEDEDVQDLLKCLRWLVAERTRRARFLASLPREENRKSRVTRDLAAKYPEQLSSIAVLIDECQVYTEYGDTRNKAEKKVRDEFLSLFTTLARLSRSVGIHLVFVSQKPDAVVLPSAIMGNCGVRVAYRVLEQPHNDQILGTSARKNGMDATKFTRKEAGLAWIRGGETADTMLGRTCSMMVDLDAADELADQAYEMRRARGLLTGQAAGEEDDPTPQLDLLADVDAELRSHARTNVHNVELAGWLAQRRPDYESLDGDELGVRLRNLGVPTPQVKVGGRTTTGIRVADLRKRLAEIATNLSNLDEE